jgi:hypothetical protein
LGHWWVLFLLTQACAATHLEKIAALAGPVANRISAFCACPEYDPSLWAKRIDLQKSAGDHLCVQGMNDIYGLDGLVIVQTITFFSVAYLICAPCLSV